MSIVDIAETISAAQNGLVTREDQWQAGKAEVAVGVGLLVTRSATNGAFKKPAAAADVTTGAAGFLPLQMGHYDGASGAEYAANEVVAVLRKGRMWVNSETALDNGGAIYVRHTANGAATTLGKVRNDADTNNAALLPNAQCVLGRADAGLVEIEFSLP